MFQLITIYISWLLFVLFGINNCRRTYPQKHIFLFFFLWKFIRCFHKLEFIGTFWVCELGTVTTMTTTWRKVILIHNLIFFKNYVLIMTWSSENNNDNNNTNNNNTFVRSHSWVIYHSEITKKFEKEKNVSLMLILITNWMSIVDYNSWQEASCNV